MKKYLSLVLLTSIIFLPSCFNKNDSGSSSYNDGSRVLISVGGKPALTEKELEGFIDQMVESNPQAKMMYQIMPEGIKDQAFDAKKHCVVLGEWAKNEGIRDSKEYKEKLAQIMDQVYCSLDQEEFVKLNKEEVSDFDVEKYYNEHKHEQHFIKEQGGVKTEAVRFNSKEDADSFAKEIIGKTKNLEKIAKEKQLHFKDYGSVNSDAFAPKFIKDAVEKVNKFPLVKTVKGDKGKFWVVVALEKTNTEHYSLDEVKPQLKQMLDQEKSQSAMAKLDEKIKSLNIKIDESYKKDLQEASQRKQEEMQKQMMGAQQPSDQDKQEDAHNDNASKELANQQSVA